jgi:hypothetical protein
MIKSRLVMVTMSVALAVVPAVVGAQMAPGGGKGPGMRGGMGPMPGGMGMGGMMQMQGTMQQMQGMLQHMADLLKSGTTSPDQMKRMGELMEEMSAHMGQAHEMMAGMGRGGRDPRAMHEQMARMQQHMADMQQDMAEMMRGGTPSASPPASPEKQ